MGHKGPVLGPRCIGPGRAGTQILIYSILFYSILFYSILPCIISECKCMLYVHRAHLQPRLFANSQQVLETWWQNLSLVVKNCCLPTRSVKAKVSKHIIIWKKIRTPIFAGGANFISRGRNVELHKQAFGTPLTLSSSLSSEEMIKSDRGSGTTFLQQEQKLCTPQ